MLISNQGTLVRTRAAEIARVGRNTQGVTLIRLPADESLVGIVKVDSLGDDDDNGPGSDDTVSGEG
jgi:DNA gyrase subunit A